MTKETKVDGHYKKDSDPKKRFLDKQGRMKTFSMFYEHRAESLEPMYTLKEFHYELEGKTYPSLKLLYLEVGDLTEYKFVQQHLYNWAHWEKLLNNAVLRRHIEEWRKELELKLRSDALTSLVKVASKPESTSTAAAKYILEKKYMSSDELKEAKDAVKKHEVKDAVQADLLRLKVIDDQ